MNDLRVALAQIAPKLGDQEANLDLHLRFVDRACGEEAGLVVFPELSLTGYHLLDQVPDLAVRPGEGPFPDLLRASRAIDIVVGFVEEGPGHRFYNAAAYLSMGEVRHVHRKLFLPTYGMFQEGREFAQGERLRGFDSPHAPCGLLICEDLWHPPCPWLLAQDGVELLLSLSNGPTRGAGPDGRIAGLAAWNDLLRVIARFHTLFAVHVNRVGCEDGLTFGGGSLVVDPWGAVVAEAPVLEEALVTVDLEAEAVRRARTVYPLLRDENLELVYRELGRIRGQRYDLPDRESHGEPVPGSGRGGRRDTEE